MAMSVRCGGSGTVVCQTLQPVCKVDTILGSDDEVPFLAAHGKWQYGTTQGCAAMHIAYRYQWRVCKKERPICPGQMAWQAEA
jgi:hypothetical protein